MKIRELERDEVRDLWSIDRTEVVERVYRHRAGELVLETEHHEVQGWPAGESEHYGPILLDCVDRGGKIYGAFEGKLLVAAAVLESRFIGREGDQLQLKFLHVSRRHRGLGLGRTLFDKAAARARALGARRLYISATPSENTVGFYLRRGCRVTDDVDRELFELEPEDIHLEFDIERGSNTMPKEPFAARLHFIPMALRRPQNALVSWLRGYFERAPGWVLLTTRGRKTGLPREVLLPCERTSEFILVISTYGWRSHWLRNIQRDPQVRVTCAGWIASGHAELVEDLDRKRELVSSHPFFPVAPFEIVHAVARTVFRPLLVWWLRRWVTPRPLVIIRPVEFDRSGGAA